MPRTPRRYTDDQLDALYHARYDHGATIANLAPLAQQGVLKLPNGTRLDPFEVNPNTVGDVLRDEKRRREGKARGSYDSIPLSDAVDDLSRRLLRVAERNVGKLERQKDPAPKDVQETARALREVRALDPVPEQRGVKPGRRGDGKAAGEQETRRTELGAGLLADHRAGEGGQTASSPEPARAQERPAEAGPIPLLNRSNAV